MEFINIFIYLSSIVDDIKDTSFFICCTCSVFYVLSRAYILTEGQYISNNLEIKKILRLLGFFVIFTFFIFILTPRKDALYLIAGIQIGKEIIESETAKKVKDVIDKKLDEILGENNERSTKTTNN